MSTLSGSPSSGGSGSGADGPRGPRSGADSRRARGAAGEARAARVLARRGYRIVERNVRVGGVEVDIIAARQTTIVFVEVKTRRGCRHGAPEEAVDARKQRRLVRAAAAWVRENPGRARRVRFDVVACAAPTARERDWRIEHWPGAFDASGG